MNYFDLALVRMSAAGPGAYMGIKYNCAQVRSVGRMRACARMC